VVPGTLVGEIDDAAREFLEESVANFAAEEEFVGVTVEQKAKAGVVLPSSLNGRCSGLSGADLATQFATGRVDSFLLLRFRIMIHLSRHRNRDEHADNLRWDLSPDGSRIALSDGYDTFRLLSLNHQPVQQLDLRGGAHLRTWTWAAEARDCLPRRLCSRERSSCTSTCEVTLIHFGK
jgi:hypothetical protein